jgi:hypothetical protein
VNGDGDLLDAWFSYYMHLGVTSFHLIVHGPAEENSRLYALKNSFPIFIEDAYGGAFHSEEKKLRLNALLRRLAGQWLLLVDSDEFVEFPYNTIAATIRAMQLVRRNALFAPMIQHLMQDGSLDTPDVVNDPFGTFPLCSVDLYQRMGVQAAISKYPLFFCSEKTMLVDGGNHSCPIGNVTSSLQGATHHFKFRRSVSSRLDKRINSSHPWRHESVTFGSYLDRSANCLPTEGSFMYSRKELFRRGLLRRLTLMTGVRHLQRVGSRILHASSLGGS